MDVIIFFRVCVALVLGSILGIERTFAGKTAGMRTYGLVSMGSALFVVTSHLIDQSYIGISNFDPMRVSAGIITGVGFLGAGIIFFKGDRISGLTTAAGLWVSCGIGMACGFGFLVPAAIATILTLFIFVVLWRIEERIRKIAPSEHTDLV